MYSMHAANATIYTRGSSQMLARIYGVSPFQFLQSCIRKSSTKDKFKKSKNAFN